MNQPHRLALFVLGCALGVSANAAPALAGHAEGAANVPGAVSDALHAALAISEARLEVQAWKSAAAACTPESASVDRSITGSGRYAVKLSGAGCGWGWATVRVFATAFVTTRPVRAGEVLLDAVKSVDQEIRLGRTPGLVNAGAKATRALGPGQLVEVSHVEMAGPPVGSSIKIQVRSGALVITQTGRAVSCGRGRVCAILPSGKHVEGVFADGLLLVELQ